jgi:hypothetical protein
MDSEELGGSFVIAVEEHGPPGLWNQIKEVSSAGERSAQRPPAAASRLMSLAALILRLGGGRRAPAGAEGPSTRAPLAHAGRGDPPADPQLLALQQSGQGGARGQAPRPVSGARAGAPMHGAPHVAGPGADQAAAARPLLAAIASIGLGAARRPRPGTAARPQVCAGDGQAPAAAQALLPQPGHLVQEPLRAPHPGEQGGGGGARRRRDGAGAGARELPGARSRQRASAPPTGCSVQLRRAAAGRRAGGQAGGQEGRRPA